MSVCVCERTNECKKEKPNLKPIPFLSLLILSLPLSSPLSITPHSCVLVRRRNDGHKCVIKEIRVEGMTQAERDEAVYEARIMAALKHTNIVQLVDPPWYVSTSSLYIRHR